MSVLRQLNALGQMRLDVSHVRSLDSGVAADFDVLVGRSMAGNQALIVRGCTLANTSASTAASAIQMAVADSILFNVNATVSGTFLWVPPDRAIETLNPVSNSRVIGSWTAGQVNYVGIDFRREADSSTADVVKFQDANTGNETEAIVPLGRTLDYRIIITTTPFSNTPNIIPVAKVRTNGSNQVDSGADAVVDARPLMYRLGTGGDYPDSTNSYPWPQGRTESGFFGGDKGFRSSKDWQDAVMSRLWELGGGASWYAPTADRNVRLVRAPPPNVFSNGDNFEITGVGPYYLHWRGLRFAFSNADTVGVHYNDISDDLAGTAAVNTLADGYCWYVDLDRTQNSAGLTVQRATLQGLSTPDVPGSRYVIAWCESLGGNLRVFTRDSAYYVGTSFSVATTSSNGAVQLNETAATPATPTVFTVGANNTLHVGTGAYPVAGGFSAITAVGGTGGGNAITATGGGTEGHGVTGYGPNNTTSNTQASTSSPGPATGGVFFGGYGTYGGDGLWALASGTNLSRSGLFAVGNSPTLAGTNGGTGAKLYGGNAATTGGNGYGGWGAYGEGGEGYGTGFGGAGVRGVGGLPGASPGAQGGWGGHFTGGDATVSLDTKGGHGIVAQAGASMDTGGGIGGVFYGGLTAEGSQINSEFGLGVYSIGGTSDAAGQTPGQGLRAFGGTAFGSGAGSHGATAASFTGSNANGAGNNGGNGLNAFGGNGGAGGSGGYGAYIQGGTAKEALALAPGATSDVAATCGSGRISNVKDPTSAQDAATKYYVDQNTLHHTVENFCVNGGFDFWQRGTGAGSDPSLYAYLAWLGAGVWGRSFGPDRWYSRARDTSIANSTSKVTMSRQTYTPISGSGSKYCLRNTLSMGVTTTAFEYNLIQEIDRNFIRKIKGEKCTLQFRMRVSNTAAFTVGGNDLHVSIVYDQNTANPDSSIAYQTTGLNDAAGATVVALTPVPGTYTSGASAYVSPQVAGSAGSLAVTTSWQTFTVTTGAIIPDGTTKLAIVFSGFSDGVTNNAQWWEIADVTLTKGSIAPDEFRWSGGTYIDELQLCQYYYQKSYDLDIPYRTATNQTQGMFRCWSFVNANGAAEALTLSVYPRYRNSMRPGNPTNAVTTYPSVSLYNPYTGLPGTWDMDATPAAGPGAALAVAVETSAANLSTEQFIPRHNAGGASGADAKGLQGHWIADAEI